MKKALRLLTSVLLVAALCFPALPGRAEATQFTFDASTGTITGYTGSGGDVVVPEMIDGTEVECIGVSAFNANAGITSVVLPAGIRRIERSAFYFCENLRSVNLPEGLEVIGPYALFSCSALESLQVPASVVYIGDLALYGCSVLSAVAFAGEAPLFGEEALAYGPDARIVTVPAEDQGAYEAALGIPCQPNGARVSVDRTIPHGDFEFDTASGTVTGYRGSAAYVTVPESIGGTPVRKIGRQAFFGNADLVRLTLPEGVEEIETKAFYASGLVGVELPESLKTIGDDAFGASKLIALSLPPGVGEIGEGAFAANALRVLSLPEGIAQLPKRAFERNTYLGDLMLPASLQQVGAGAFAGCNKLTYVVFAGQDLPALGEGAFADCPIEDVDIAWDANKEHVAAARAALSAVGLPMDSIPIWRANRADQAPYPNAATFVFDDATGAVTSYEGDLEEMTMYWSFYGQNSEKFPVRALGPGLFEGSGLRRFFVPHSDALETIGDRAFAGSNLEYIYLFDSVTVIGEEAFQGCAALASIVIPDSVGRIGSGAFEGCTALEEVVFAGGMPEIGDGAFKDCASLSNLVLPEDAKIAGTLGVDGRIVRIADAASDAQLEAMAQSLDLPWFVELHRESEPSSFAAMPGDYAPNAASDFEFDASTGTITKYIGQISQVVVPRAIEDVPVERIGSLAFSNATVMSYLADDAVNIGLTSVVLPETVRFIEDSAFLECGALKEFTCYGPVDRLGIRAFENCTALERVAFVNGVREIAGYAFNLNAALETAALGDKVASIGEWAFNGAGLKGDLTLTAPAIGTSAFRDCKNIVSIRVTASVSEIGAGAFLGAEALERIYFDRPDVNTLGFGNFQFSEDMDGFELCLPESATDDEVAAFVSALDQNLLPGADMVIRRGYP